MSRGRKKVVPNSSDWESVFYNSVGTYVQYINLKLAEHIKAEPLSNHIRIAGGYAFKSSEYKTKGVPVIRISDFSNEKIVLDDVVYYDESEDLKRYELNEGDIVIALTGGTIAKLGIVQKGIGKLYLNQRVGKFEVLHPEEFETEYVYWIARSVQSIIKTLAWGAAIPNVSPKQIEELQFPIPDKETQNGIIDFLNDLRANKLEEDKEYFNREVEDFIFSLQINQFSCSELQSELTNQQDLVKQLRQAFFNDAMKGKLVKQNFDEGNATDLLKKIKKERASLLVKNKVAKENLLAAINDEEIPFNIPSNWAWCRLGEIIRISSGDGLTSRQMDQNGNIPVYGGNGITGYHNKFNLEEETIVIGRVGYYCGSIHLTEKYAWVTDNAFRVFYSVDNINREFLIYLLKWADLGKQQYAGSQPVISGQRVYPILLPFPPLKEQQRIAKKLDEVLNLSDELALNITRSKTDNEKLIQILLNEALGVETTYDVEKEKTLKQEIRKFQTTDNSFERTSMKIIEILQSSKEPISATVVWNSSEYSKDIEGFYAELKRLIDIEKLVVEEKRGKESFLKLAANEN